jgi:hypothetical protein
MPFEYLLADLLSRVDGALGVLFLDDSGEAVDLACAEASPYQMRVVGAYAGIYLRQMAEFLRASGQGEPRWLHVEKEDLHLYAAPLPDGYYVVLVQRAPALTGRARRLLEQTRDQLGRELFAGA